MNHLTHPDNFNRQFLQRERPHAPYQSPPFCGGSDDLDRLAAQMDDKAKRGSERAARIFKRQTKQARDLAKPSPSENADDVKESK